VSNAACIDNDLLSCLTFWKTLFHEIKPFNICTCFLVNLSVETFV
jgi:hypothetical protein